MTIDGKMPFPAAEASRDAALRRLQKFLPNAGWTYASHRNVDAGPTGTAAVSQLSPWIRHRVITEQEVLQATVRLHGLLPSKKFVEEILWRTYWKGWLELRPQIWSEYRDRLASNFQLLRENSKVKQQFDVACRGETGIACFDAWVKELCGCGYLHNHARMWFASIWIFTLGLPWELGADFFLQNLIDGDAASNTLSWRWVAGLHTRGKHYVAKADNITKNTLGRFHPVGELDERPLPLESPVHPAPRALPTVDSPNEGKVFLLLHEDDLGIEDFPIHYGISVYGAGISIAPRDRSPLGCSGLVESWIRTAAVDVKARTKRVLSVETPLLDEASIVSAVIECGADFVLTPCATVGWTADRLSRIENNLAQANVPLKRVRRLYDSKCWLAATAGFFDFRKAMFETVRPWTIEASYA